MKCARCQKEVEKNMPQDGMCQNCFVDLVENRARKALSGKNLKKGDKILIVDDGSKEFIVGEYLFKKILEKIPLTINVKKKDKIDLEKAQKEYTAIILPQDMDDEAETLITAMIENKPLQKEKIINVLQNVYDKEVKLYADIHKFDYLEQEKGKIQKAISKIEKSYPQVQFAIVQSIKSMQKKK